MAVTRIVSDLSSSSLEAAQRFYTEVLGLEVVMDHGWIVTLASPTDPSLQISVMTNDAHAPVVPDVSVEVDDLDAAYEAAVQRGDTIVYPVTEEPWGVRRFFAADPDGHVINILSHRREQ
ncbi:VOC family protein [Rhodococcus qingshengii]|uniref:VOC family protein n=1 Tax=Rhodococcus qingshengii TaxID=334542 RepID=UPI001877B4A4|nr:VOC family protein [Rhodococcus qingshengii]QOS63228.1 VOC family protein [Rhodococcus qingshengii]